jgi:hypothetical protein
MTSTDSYATSKIQEGLYLHKYVEIIDGLRPDSTFSVDPSLPNFIDFYLEDSAKFIDLLRDSIYHIIGEKRGLSKLPLIKSEFANLKIKLLVDDVTTLHEISAKNENCR